MASKTRTQVTAPPRNGQPETALTRLLSGYRETLELTAHIPKLLRLRAGDGRISHWVPIFRVGIGTRYFALHHVDRALTALERRYHALAAVADDDRYKPEFDALAHFRQALSPVPYKRLILSFALAAGLGAGLLAKQVFPGSGADTAVNKISDALGKLDAAGVVDAYSSNAEGAVGATLTVLLLLAVLLYPPGTTFRFKRSLFSLDPPDPGRLKDRPAYPQPSGAGGLYLREANAFTAAGARPPREFPFDLVVQALAILLLLPIWIILSARIVEAGSEAGGGGLLDVLAIWPVHWGVAVGIALLAPLRLGHLHRVWLIRNGELRAERRLRADARPESVEPLPFNHTQVASWTRRVPAAAIDVLAVMILAFTLGEILYAAGLTGDALGFVVLVVCIPVAGLAYSMLMLRRAHRGQTLGKQLLDLRVVRKKGGGDVGVRQVLVREGLVRWFFVGSLSWLLLGLPLLATTVVGLMDGPNQALEDRLASTLVVDASARPS